MKDVILLLLFFCGIAAPLKAYDPAEFQNQHDGVWVCEPNTVWPQGTWDTRHRAYFQFQTAITPMSVWDQFTVVSPDPNVLPYAWTPGSGYVRMYVGFNSGTATVPPEPPITVLKVYTFEIFLTDIDVVPNRVVSMRCHLIADPAYTGYDPFSPRAVKLGFAPGGDPTYWVGRYPGGSNPPPPSGGGGSGGGGGDEDSGCTISEDSQSKVASWLITTILAAIAVMYLHRWRNRQTQGT